MCGGGGAAAPANTSSTISQTTIPGWAKPMAQAAMGSAMEQAFNIDRRTGDILGPKQYIPYGVDPALQDAVVKAQSNPILNWSPAQQKKHPQQYAAAQAQLADAQRNFQQAGQKAYMPYEQGETYGENGSSRGSAAVAGFSPMQMQAFRDAQALRLPSQFAEGSDLVRQAAAGSLGIAQQAPQLAQAALGYGAQAAGYGAQAAGYGGTASNIGQEAYQRAVQDAAKAAGMSDIYGKQGSDYGATAADMARLGYEAEQRYKAAATSPAAMQQYMNPYVQAALAPQLQQLAQQTGIAGAAQQAAATSSGAFGGSRSALANALTQQAGNLAAQQALGQGYNQAYQQALQSLQYGSGLGIQGLQAGTGAQQAGIAGAQTGLQGVGQRINAGQLAVQGAQAGIQGQATGIQGAGVGVQGAGVGVQGVNAATAANQMGLSGYGQVGNQGVNLANIGNQQLGAQQGIIGFQSQLGGMQQQQAQNIINAAMNQYDRSQEYPYQQIGFMSNILRGTPVQGTGSVQQYQAAPNPWSQVAGLGMNLAGSAMGRYANGGIVDAALVNALRG